MPSTATITSFYSFTALTKIVSAEVNNNFSVFRGHMLPVDPSTATAATSGTYDLGASDHYWRGIYNQYSIIYQNTAGSVPAAPSAGYIALYAKDDGKIYKKTPAGTESEVGGGAGALVMTGSRASPTTITAAGITFAYASGARQLMFITGDTMTGTVITANPQISGGTVGAELILCVPNTTTSRPVIIEHGNGLDINGYFAMTAGCNLYLFHDGMDWIETSRKEA